MSRADRRQFVKSVALGASVGSLAGSEVLLANEPKKELPSKEEGLPSEAEARMNLVISRFGKHLGEEERNSVRAKVESLVHRAESLRRFPLDNGDGPFPVFTPYRAPLKDS